MFNIILIGAVLVLFVALYFARGRKFPRFGTPSESAFGKLATADSKLAALQAAIEAKREEVTDAHVEIDELLESLG